MAGTLLNKKIGIIGGGVTGVITAIFLAKSGCSVTIFEKKELLSETSSRTTKLLHGGIRYLESFQIKEVKNGLNDR
jgi:glycerol-3-phosphate dehydrogenase